MVVLGDSHQKNRKISMWRIKNIRKGSGID